ncbi:hypothetical protein SAMN02800692_2739 [Luteibacter sp. UNC138MFCol5.1]|uniref:hypothetical protein n=1 Tax=Luteibacter sp. UNC138MFCol5.1 TaxID=1502774 RepID=UPI0008B9C4EB|nr:hypothetical protein [Luteibacter sp. UNC138MFCol5.1]SEO91395.1 hypothetical protein SAMN02800692_2739 [Luteibacter sp. UNC138MFCol5.1]
MGHDPDEEDRIDVECMRDSRDGEVPRFTWDYRVFARDMTTIIDTSDSGGVSYDSEKMALSEGRRMAREALERLDRR